MANYLNLVVAYETGAWKACRELSRVIGVTEEVLPADYAAAVGWADAYPVL